LGLCVKGRADIIKGWSCNKVAVKSKRGIFWLIFKGGGECSREILGISFKSFQQNGI